MDKNYFTNPKALTLAATYDATISTSTAVTLNTKTALIEVSAIDKGIFLKWNGTASSTSFDEFIPANTIRSFVFPADTLTVEFIEEAATAKLVLIEK